MPFKTLFARMSGDIVLFLEVQVDRITGADTICAPEVSEAIHAQPIDPPTLAMTFSVNDSPLEIGRASCRERVFA